VSGVLEWVWFAVKVAALVAVCAVLLVGAQAVLGMLVGRWVSTPDDWEFENEYRDLGFDDDDPCEHEQESEG
jgi:hypothetical protein